MDWTLLSGHLMSFFRFVKTKKIVCVTLLFFIVMLKVNCTSQGEVQSEPERNREITSTSQTPEKKEVSGLEQVGKSGTATPEYRKEYEEYSSWSSEDKNREAEAGQGTATSKELPSKESVGTTNTEYSGEYPYEGMAAGQVNGEPGELDVLEKELDDSLREFDDMLLKEMDEIRAKRQGKAGGITESGAAASEGMEGTGTGVSASSGKPGSEEYAQGGEAGETGGAGKDREHREGEVVSGEGSGTASGTGYQGEGAGSGADTSTSSGTRGKPPYGSTQDDDVVARQIREAAEKETDPVLKEKLWKEYEEYKKGKSGNQ